VDRAVAEEGEQPRHHCRDGDTEAGRDVQQVRDRLTGQHTGGDVVADVHDDRHQVGDGGAEEPELGPALHHLRESQYRTLRGVVGHEQATDQVAEHDGDDRARQARASSMPITPVVTASTEAFIENHSGNSEAARPCRSSSGIRAMACSSTSSDMIPHKVSGRVRGEEDARDRALRGDVAIVNRSLKLAPRHASRLGPYDRNITVVLGFPGSFRPRSR